MTAFDPAAIPAKHYLLAAALAEVRRELGLRRGAYPKFIEAGKLKPENAVAQYGAMLKAEEILAWFSASGDDVKIGLALMKKAKAHTLKWKTSLAGEVDLAFALLDMVREHPFVLTKLTDDPALATVIGAFPGAQLEAIRQLGTQEAAE